MSTKPVLVNDVTLQRVLDEDTTRTSALIDGATGQVIEDAADSCDRSQQTLALGFGPTAQLFEVSPPRFQPWLSTEIIEMEVALQGGEKF